jgi:hypothetical protein
MGRRSPSGHMSVSISEAKIRRAYRVDIKPVIGTGDLRLWGHMSANHSKGSKAFRLFPSLDVYTTLDSSGI